MSPAELEIMRSVEDDLWWYRALRSHVVAAITARDGTFTLLDAGCGSGGMLAHIRAAFPAAELTGIDLMPRAIELTATRNLRVELVQGSADALPFRDQTFDFVTSLDVIASGSIDDAKAAGEAWRVLRHGGNFIINVPALECLRGSHDVATNMARRYSRSRLRRLLHDAGFTIDTLTFWNMSLTPAVALVRLASRRAVTKKTNVRSDLAPMGAGLNRALTALAKTELAVTRLVPLPFGSSLFAVARK
jgi:SAM-dependent methyltransferase